MEKYEKGETKEVECPLPFDANLIKEITIMKLKPGSKIQNIVGFAEKKMRNPDERRILFAGIGSACNKVITAVEVMKRHSKDSLFQLNKICFRRIEEYWEPTEDGLERLRVNRDIPAMYILLSKDPLPAENGCQSPGEDLLLSKPSSSNRQNRAFRPNQDSRYKRKPKQKVPKGTTESVHRQRHN